jgi:23S rRNA pseudouridine1911/1915/1917 synthase
VKKTVTFTVPAERAGARLDKLVVEHAALGRRRAAELFAAGQVLVQGRSALKGDAASAGDEVTIVLDADDRAKPEPEAPLDIRLETRDLVIANKPAGQPSAPLRGEPGTLASALLGRYPEMEGIGHSPREPGLLHRLDTQTSGLVIAARSTESFSRLHRALRDGEMTKRYLAVVLAEGLDEAGSIDAPISPDRKNPRRVRVASPAERGVGRNRPRPALTRFRIARHAGQWALLQLEVSRALRHQIRAHLASIGHPIAGDEVYGGAPAAGLVPGRHALHASYVAWAGDETIPGFALEEPLPDDMASLIAG